MRDCFALLEIPRAPFADADVLTDSFHRAAAAVHPDAPGGSTATFTELNEAWQTLRDPAGCLRHFLELEHPALLEIARRPPVELENLFAEIATTRQLARDFLAKRKKSTSALHLALLEPERIALSDHIESISDEIKNRTDTAQKTVRKSDVPPDELARMLSTLVFLRKWMSGLRECALELAPMQAVQATARSA